MQLKQKKATKKSVNQILEIKKDLSGSFFCPEKFSIKKVFEKQRPFYFQFGIIIIEPNIR